MKKVLIFVCILCLILPLYSPLVVSAEEPSGVMITVVMPEQKPPETGTPTVTEPAVRNVKILYPIDVTETFDGERRTIMKTYEIGDNENPDDIPRESFIRDGYTYTLTDITKTAIADAESQEHIETVEINSASKSLSEILKLLDETVDYTADGFSGVLTLDVSSIKITDTAKTSSSYTQTLTREYPNLSGNDTSVIPKTVTENGATYTLAGVDWKTQTMGDVEDYHVTYTGTAKYTRTATSTKVTGYTVSAEYKGIIAKLNNSMIYTAYFSGTEIVTPLEMIEPETVTVTTAETEPSETDTETIEETLTEETEQEQQDGVNPLLIAIPVGVVAAIGIYFAVKKSKGSVSQ
jgi:hypothetical protein